MATRARPTWMIREWVPDSDRSGRESAIVEVFDTNEFQAKNAFVRLAINGARVELVQMTSRGRTDVVVSTKTTTNTQIDRLYKLWAFKGGR